MSRTLAVKAPDDRPKTTRPGLDVLSDEIDGVALDDALDPAYGRERPEDDLPGTIDIVMVGDNARFAERKRAHNWAVPLILRCRGELIESADDTPRSQLDAGELFEDIEVHDRRTVGDREVSAIEYKIGAEEDIASDMVAQRPQSPQFDAAAR